MRICVATIFPFLIENPEETGSNLTVKSQELANGYKALLLNCRKVVRMAATVTIGTAATATLSENPTAKLICATVSLLGLVTTIFAVLQARETHKELTIGNALVDRLTKNDIKDIVLRDLSFTEFARRKAHGLM